MKNVTLSAKWLAVVFAALFLAACSSNETKEADAEAEAAAAEQVAQEAAAREAEQEAQAAAQETREAAVPKPLSLLREAL